jgi:predicted dehydrogenase
VNPLRIAVVGVGHMGRRHAEKVYTLQRTGRGVSLAGVADHDLERARAVAAEFGTRAESEGEKLFSEADAAIIAVPTVCHGAVAEAALRAGLHVLLEKPIAATLPEAESLVALAERDDRILHVGHQEWFNAAMRAVRERIHVPRFAEIHRMGPFTARATDVDVVRDLMIHDIEILQQLLGDEEPTGIDAVGISILTDHIDIANARLTFSSRCVANLTASRVSAQPLRKFRLFQRDAYFSIDFLEQKAALFRRLPARGDEGPRIEMEELATDPEDAMLAQLEGFVRTIREGAAAARPSRLGVTGREAAAALRTALRVIEAMPSIDEIE